MITIGQNLKSLIRPNRLTSQTEQQRQENLVKAFQRIYAQDPNVIYFRHIITLSDHPLRPPEEVCTR